MQTGPCVMQGPAFVSCQRCGYRTNTRTVTVFEPDL
jgi:hypothetical protein